MISEKSTEVPKTLNIARNEKIAFFIPNEILTSNILPRCDFKSMLNFKLVSKDLYGRVIEFYEGLETNEEGLPKNLFIQSIINLKVNQCADLKELYIKEISEDETSFPKELESLEFLYVAHLAKKVTSSEAYFYFESDIKVLKYLYIKKIENVEFIVNARIFENVQNFCIENILSFGIFNTITPFNALTVLTIENIEKNAAVQFEDSLNNLKKLSIGKIGEGAIFEVKERNKGSLIKLEELSIRQIDSKAIFELPTVMDNLKTIFMGNIQGEKPAFIWPTSLDRLSCVTISNTQIDFSLNDDGSLNFMVTPNGNIEQKVEDQLSQLISIRNCKWK